MKNLLPVIILQTDVAGMMIRRHMKVARGDVPAGDVPVVPDADVSDDCSKALLVLPEKSAPSEGKTEAEHLTLLRQQHCLEFKQACGTPAEKKVAEAEKKVAEAKKKVADAEAAVTVAKEAELKAKQADDAAQQTHTDANEEDKGGAKSAADVTARLLADATTEKDTKEAELKAAQTALGQPEMNSFLQAGDDADAKSKAKLGYYQTLCKAEQGGDPSPADVEAARLEAEKVAKAADDKNKQGGDHSPDDVEAARLEAEKVANAEKVEAERVEAERVKAEEVKAEEVKAAAAKKAEDEKKKKAGLSTTGGAPSPAEVEAARVAAANVAAANVEAAKDTTAKAAAKGDTPTDTPTGSCGSKESDQ